MTDYAAFLREKIRLARFAGFEVSADEINPVLKPHTKDIVRWACQGGQRAIKLGRRAGGSELNAAYFLDQVHYLQAAEREFAMPALFDLEQEETVDA